VLLVTGKVFNAEDIDWAQVAIKAFEIDFGAKYPNAVAKVVEDADALWSFTDIQPSIGYT